ncbi:MAG: MBL fold metallo-hydrolase [Clostridium sp.]|nr:MBL fold metallo-hydrolase [Clostridium sp.]
MDIKVLLENDKERKEYEDAHGLSLYIEALGRKILFDFGPGEEFMRNARKMDIKIDEIDFAVLSHGHIDHGGGLPYFLDENKKAPVYIHPKALEPHYSRREDGIMNDIGLPESIKNSKRIVFKQGINWIDDNMALISYLHEEMMIPPGNETLY